LLSFIFDNLFLNIFKAFCVFKYANLQLVLQKLNFEFKKMFCKMMFEKSDFSDVKNAPF